MQTQLSYNFEIATRIRSEQEIQTDLEEAEKQCQKNCVPDPDCVVNCAITAATSEVAYQKNAGEVIDSQENSDDADHNPLMGMMETSDDSNERVEPVADQKIVSKTEALVPTEANTKQVKKAKPRNLEVVVKNLDTLDEYTLTTWFQPEYIERLQNWIAKKKYIVTEMMEEVLLQVEIFRFNLKKSEKSDEDIIQEEMARLQERSMAIILDQKLFQYYFSSFWKERAREVIPSYMKSNIIDDPRALFNICEGVGFEEVENHRSRKRAYYIGFAQPSPFIYHSSSREEEMMLQQKRGKMCLQDDWLEVFVNGRSLPHALINISRQMVKQVVGQQQPLFLHRVNVPVRKGEKYQLFTPKQFC